MSKEAAAGQLAETGRVLAQLDDWRAITFVLVVVIVVLLLERYFAQKDMRIERQAMMKMANEFATNSGKVAEAMSALRQELMSLRLTTARVESTAAHMSEAVHDAAKQP